MKKNLLVFPGLALAACLCAQAQTKAAAPGKIGIIHIQNAIISTKDGQKAATELQSRFAPKKAEIEKKQNDIAQLQDQLRKGSNTMSDDAKQKLMRDIDQNTKSLNRETEDAQAELDQEQGKIMQELGQRMMAVITKYAKDNGFSLILDVSSPQTPVLYAANEIDITNDIISLYDRNAPASPMTTLPSKPPAAPAATAAPARVGPPKK
ncbi:MAG TPA: OmpH family outer membrane protein [Bryobacteraceae bacterium]|nr:OmpH family outer membrane protein [Bryobacteraceae bacterium]